MDVVAIVPASLSREGAPTGILHEVAGAPVLGHLLDRLKGVDKLAGLMVATTDAPEDAAVAAFCAGRGVPCHAGVGDDLLGRLLAAVKQDGAKGAVMVEAGNPLIVPAVVDQVVNLLQLTDGMLDWVGNTAAPTYPKGMEIDGFTAAALTEADRRCAEPELRREGPAFLWKNSRLYRLLSVTAPEGQERPELDLKVRSPDDLARLEPVLAHFAGRGDFTLADVLGFLEGAAP